MVVTINIATILAALGAAAGGIAAASVIWLKFVRPVSRPARELFAWLAVFREDWDGVPDRPGVPGRPGMMVRMATLESEFKPNGGDSLRDQVNLIQRRQAAIESMAMASPNGGERQAAA